MTDDERQLLTALAWMCEQYLGNGKPIGWITRLWEPVKAPLVSLQSTGLFLHPDAVALGLMQAKRC